jgi:Sigma-70, region 4.
VIERRYFRGQTYTEIAMTLELSRERVRQIEKSALKLLRESYELKQLTVYSPYRHVGLENFKHNGSIEEQIAERKEFDRWRNNILERILKKG